MSAHHDSRRSITGDVGFGYYYRRSLTGRELLPALGIGIGAGAVAFYLAKLFLERTPLQRKVTAVGDRLATARSDDTRVAARNGR